MKFLFSTLSKVTFGFLLLFGAFSCNNDDDPTPVEPIAQNCRVTKTTVTGVQTVTVTYDNNSRVTAINYNNESEDDEREVFEYNSAGKLAKIKYVTPANEVFSYSDFVYNTDGLLSKEQVFDYWGVPGNEYLHLFDIIREYNSNKQLVKVTYTEPNDPNDVIQYQTYEYNTAGNVTRSEGYITGLTNNGLYRVTQYTYDDKKNSLFSNLYSDVNAFSLSKNNVLTETETIYFPSTSTKVTNHAYVYTPANFPLTETVTVGNQVIQKSFDYTCSE